MLPVHWFIVVFCGWVQQEQHDVVAFLREENRLLRAQLGGRRLRLRDPERRRLAVLGHRLGRRTLAEVATIVSPDTVLRWHRDLVLRRRPSTGRRGGRPRLQAPIRLLVVRMASENATWGYTRIQGALKNLGHRVARSTIARILKEEGVPPSGQRPTAWRTFVQAHWPMLLDFFTPSAPTLSGWVTDDAAVTMRQRSHSVTLLGSRLPPDRYLISRRAPVDTKRVLGAADWTPTGGAVLSTTRLHQRCWREAGAQVQEVGATVPDAREGAWIEPSRSRAWSSTGTHRVR